LNRSIVRALLASAAVAAAIALAGCDSDSITPTGRSQAPLSEKTLAEIEAKHMDKDSPILARIFKEEAEMEVWKKDRDGSFALLKTYPICRWSGDLGPKKKEGDRQAPEGFYTITPGQMNPASNYFLAFNTGYPNAYDRSWGYTGSELMVHGDCSSRGCYAMTDEQIQEIYALARESFFGGQKDFQLQAFPFRMTALNMAKHRNNSNFAFWKMIKEGYDHFEATHQEPKVAVCEKHYVFDPAAPENASKPPSFNSRGQCPAYRLDPTIADAVNDHRRQEQFQMASYIARDVATVPSRSGIDGGMNPVFLAKLSTHDTFDNDGRAYKVAGNSQAPGALPRTTTPPAVTAELGQDAQPAASRPVVMASVRMPQPAPQAKEGEALPEQPKSITGLLGNLFSSAPAQAKTTEPAADGQAVALRGSNSDTSAKSKRATPVRTASAPAAPQPKPHEIAPAKPKAIANNAPAPAPHVQQARKEASAAPAPEMRTAYSTPPASNSGLLSGAQPVVPAGTFENRWTALR
jgi:murein L,D-transpeptidase YafK